MQTVEPRRYLAEGRGDGGPHHFVLGDVEGLYEADVGRIELRFLCGAGNLAGDQVIGDQRARDLLVDPSTVRLRKVSSAPSSDCFNSR